MIFGILFNDNAPTVTNPDLHEKMTKVLSKGDFANGDGPLAYCARCRADSHSITYDTPSYHATLVKQNCRTVHQCHKNIASYFDTKEARNGASRERLMREKSEYYIETSHLVYRYQNDLVRAPKASGCGDGPVKLQQRPPPRKSRDGWTLGAFIQMSNDSEGGYTASGRQLDPINREDTPQSKKDVVDQYKQSIDPLHLRSIPLKEENDECPECRSKSLVFEQTDSTVQCTQCGYCNYEPIMLSTPSYRTNRTTRPTMTLYKRINHFNDWITQFQAKESIAVPDIVYNAILTEVTKTKKSRRRRKLHVTTRDLRRILRKLGYNKYYEHIPRIMHRLQGTPPPTISQETEEQMRFMFKCIQEPFTRHSPKDRKNFLSYSFVLRKFVGLLGLKQLESSFPLLKSRTKLYQQDVIWRKICGDLGWRYEPSI